MRPFIAFVLGYMACVAVHAISAPDAPSPHAPVTVTDAASLPDDVTATALPDAVTR